MWEIDLNLQIQTALLSVVVGAAFCFVFDIFNILEEKLFRSKVAVLIADIFLFVCFAFFEFCFFLATQNGEIRAFVFVCEAIGFFICKKTIALVYIPIILLLFKVFKKLLYSVYRIFIRPFLNFFGKFKKKFLKIGQKRFKFIKKA